MLGSIVPNSYVKSINTKQIGGSALAEPNRLRFQSLAERVEQLAADVSTIRHREKWQLDDATEAVFPKELEYWRMQDRSIEFRSFYREVSNRCRTLAELYHHRRKVCGALVRHLRRGAEALQRQRVGSMRLVGSGEGGVGIAVPSLLSLVAVLCRDLGGELLSEFGSLVRAVMEHMDPARPEIAAVASQAMAYMFRYLGRDLAKDMGHVRGIYGPLLGHRASWARRFASESLVLLLRFLTPKKAAKHIAAVTRAACDDVGVDVEGRAWDGGRPMRLREGVARLVHLACRAVPGLASLDRAVPIFGRLLEDGALEDGRKFEVLFRSVLFLVEEKVKARSEPTKTAQPTDAVIIHQLVRHFSANATTITPASHTRLLILLHSLLRRRSASRASVEQVRDRVFRASIPALQTSTFAPLRIAAAHCATTLDDSSFVQAVLTVPDVACPSIPLSSLPTLLTPSPIETHHSDPKRNPQWSAASSTPTTFLSNPYSSPDAEYTHPIPPETLITTCAHILFRKRPHTLPHIVRSNLRDPVLAVWLSNHCKSIPGLDKLTKDSISSSSTLQACVRWALATNAEFTPTTNISTATAPPQELASFALVAPRSIDIPQLLERIQHTPTTTSEHLALLFTLYQSLQAGHSSGGIILSDIVASSSSTKKYSTLSASSSSTEKYSTLSASSSPTKKYSDHSSSLETALLPAVQCRDRSSRLLALGCLALMGGDGCLADVLFRSSRLPASPETERERVYLMEQACDLLRDVEQVQLGVCAAVGMLHERFAPLWSAASLLIEAACAVDATVAWPILEEALVELTAESTSRMAEVYEANLVVETCLDPTESADAKLDALERRAGIPVSHFRDERIVPLSSSDPEKRQRLGLGVGGSTDPSVAQSSLCEAIRKSVTKLSNRSLLTRIASANQDVLFTLLRHHPDAVNHNPLVLSSSSIDLLRNPKIGNRVTVRRVVGVLDILAASKLRAPLPRPLEVLCFRLLSRPDSDLASHALDVLLSQRPRPPDALAANADHLRGMIGDGLRTELIHWVLEESIEPAHRPVVVQAALRIIFGRLSDKNVHGGAQSRRNIVLAFCLQLEPEEIDIFLYLCLRPFLAKHKSPPSPSTKSSPSTKLSTIEDEEKDDDPLQITNLTDAELTAEYLADFPVPSTEEEARQLVKRIRLPKLALVSEFLELERDVIRRLGHQVMNSAHLLLASTLHMAESSDRKVRSAAILRLADAVEILVGYEPLADAFQPLLVSKLTSALESTTFVFSLANSSSPPAELRLLHSMCSSEVHVAAVAEIPNLVPSLAKAIEATETNSGPSPPVLALIYGILECLIRFDAQAMNVWESDDSRTSSAAADVSTSELRLDCVRLLPFSNQLLTSLATRHEMRSAALPGKPPANLQAHFVRESSILAAIAMLTAHYSTLSSSSLGGEASVLDVDPVATKLVQLLAPSLRLWRFRNAKQSHSAPDVSTLVDASITPPSGPAADATRLLQGDQDRRTSVLRALAAIIPLVKNPRPIIQDIVFPLGPGVSTIRGTPRAALVSIVTAMHSSSPSLQFLRRASTRHGDTYTDTLARSDSEWDVDAVLDALRDISRAASRLVADDLNTLNPLFRHLLFLLLDEQHLIASAALNTAVAVATALIRAGCASFINFNLLPPLHEGILSRDRDRRRFFILLLSSVIQQADLHRLQGTEIPLDLAVFLSSASEDNNDDDDNDDDEEQQQPDDILQITAPPPSSSSAAAASTAAAGPRDSDGSAPLARGILPSFAHPQIYNRVKAMRRAAAVLQRRSTKMSEEAMTVWLMPLTRHVLLDVPPKVKLARKGVIEENDAAASDLMAAIAKRLSWIPYERLLLSVLKDIRNNPPRDSGLLQTLVKILTVFRFPVADGIEYKQYLDRLDATPTRKHHPSPSSPSTPDDPEGDNTHKKEDEEDVTHEKEEEEEEEEEEDGEFAPDLEAVETDSESPFEVRRILERVVLPQLGRLMHRERRKASKVDRMLTLPGSSQIGVAAKDSRAGELREPVAIAIAQLLVHVPPDMFRQQLPPLLAGLCKTLRSRSQGHRDTARKAMAKVAGTLGPEHLDTVLDEIRQSLAEGYMVHVASHTLATILTQMEPLISMPGPLDEAEVARAMERVRANLERKAAKKREDEVLGRTAEDDEEDRKKTLQRLHEKERRMDVLEEADEDDDVDDDDDPAKPLTELLPVGVQALVRALPGLLDAIMEDVFGAAASARNPDSGYRPKFEMKEATRSRGPETYELLARCIPFLPHPAVHLLVTPVVRELQGGPNTYSGAADAVGATGVEFAGASGAFDRRTAKTAEEMLSRLALGMCANRSVRGPALTTYSYCLMRDNLRVPGVIRRDVAEMLAVQTEGRDVSGEDEGTLLDRLLQAASEAGTKQGRDKRRAKIRHVQTWIVNNAYEIGSDAAAVDRLPPGSTSRPSFSTDTVEARAAAVAGRTRTPKDTFRVLPEPKMTGTGRYVWGTGDQRAGASGTSAAVAVTLVRAAANLLARAIKKRVVDPADVDCKRMLESVLPMLLRTAATVRDPATASQALRVVGRLATEDLASWSRYGSSAVRTTMLHLADARSVTSAKSRELADTSVTTVTDLLLNVRECSLSREELQALVAVVEANLGPTKHHSTALRLLGAIVGRRLLAPEVYDVMEHVARASITDTRAGTRVKSAAVMIRFLLTYPMEERRLKQHLHFYLRNLEYSSIQGRQAALEALHAIVRRFPSDVLAAHAGRILLPVVVRLVQDPATVCRAAAGSVVRQLATSLDTGHVQNIAKMVLAWSDAAQKPILRQAAFQTASILLSSHSAALLRPLKDDQSSTSSPLHRLIDLARLEIATAVEQVRDREEELFVHSAAADDTLEAEQDNTQGRDIDEIFDQVFGAQSDDEEDDEDDFEAGNHRKGEDDFEAGNHRKDEDDFEAGNHRKDEDDFEAGNHRKDEDDFEVDSRQKGEKYFEVDSRQKDEQDFSKVVDGPIVIEGGMRGGGGEVMGLEAVRRKRAKKSGEEASPETKVLATLEWRPVYHALGFLLDAWTSHGAEMKRELGSAGGGRGGAGSKRGREEGEETVVGVVVSALLYPHAWVRLAATRVYGAMLARGVDERLDEASRRLTGQLSAPTIGPAQASLTAQCLLGVVGADESLLESVAGRIANTCLRGPLLSRLAGLRLFESLVSSARDRPKLIHSLTMAAFRLAGDAGEPPRQPRATPEEQPVVNLVLERAGGIDSVQESIQLAAQRLAEALPHAIGRQPFEEAMAHQRQRRIKTQTSKRLEKTKKY